MPRDEPSWWYGEDGGLRVRLLRPVSRVWAGIADKRMAEEARYSSTPSVVCVGNFTAGGTGKTPLSLTIAERLKARGLSPAFLSRGYGAKRKGPCWVDPSRDTAREAGDEPMLLARIAPVMISADRAAGARLIEAREPHIDAIVMDDGFQNPALAKDLRIAVVDGRRGIGNGEVMPAGPLRASFALQLAHTDAIVVNLPPGAATGDVPGSPLAMLRSRFQGPVLAARVGPSGNVERLKAKPLLAFSGIANPRRFYDLLAALGAEVTETRSFPDHHAFTEREAGELLAQARALGAALVTTEKDAVRLIGGAGALSELAAMAETLPVRLTFDEDDERRLEALLDGIAAKCGAKVSGVGGGP